MANEDLLKALGSVEEWATYRKEKGITNPDFTDMDLAGRDLSGYDLVSASFEGADLRNANLTRAKLIYADFSWANLDGATCRNARLDYADFTATSLTGADLRGANLKGAQLSGVGAEGLRVGSSYITGIVKGGVIEFRIMDEKLRNDYPVVPEGIDPREFKPGVDPDLVLPYSDETLLQIMSITFTGNIQVYMNHLKALAKEAKSVEALLENQPAEVPYREVVDFYSGLGFGTDLAQTLAYSVAPPLKIQLDPSFSPEAIIEILDAMANLFRACGGAGFDINLQYQELLERVPVGVR